ncbi:MAG: penicillin acylase family protein [Bacteroidetes bacterium]|nr:penicillin acylase family protein [Bacteroidota bacterium]HET6245173.1 penicillin acylase family protein [Bacteroidia bacterium]
MIKRILVLLLCFLWIGLTFYRPAGLFQSIGTLFTYSTGVFSLRSPDAKVGNIELKSQGKFEVDIHIDIIGIPHIYGKDASNVSFGMGYMHARDRYFQMEIITRVVQGRLAEVLGKKVTSSDIFWKPLEIEVKAMEVLSELHVEQPEVYKQLMAYNAGVSFYIDQEKPNNNSPEYRLLGFAPRKWESHYPVLLSWYMNYMLTYKDRHAEREQVLLSLPANLIEELYGLNNEQYPFIITDTTFTTVIPENSSPVKVFGKLDKQTETIGEKELRQSIGSNNWAVSANKSATARAMLCNDTHLDISLPNPWYEAHLVCPEFNVYGFSIPCSPFIISGYNENIAWGITNGGWDLSDRFLLKTNPDNKNEYWYEGAWKKMQEKQYVIRQNNAKDTVVKQQFTIYGPVVHGEKQVYAQKWYPAGKTSSVISFNYLARAKNWEDFKNALSYFSYPPQNFAYADKQGNIGMISAGKMPLRYAGYKGGLLDGSKKHREQFVPFSSLPQQFKPAQGFVYSANQNPANTDYYIEYDFHDTYRAKRIFQLLAQNKNLSIKDMKAIQADRKDIGIEDIKALIKKYKKATGKWKLIEPLEHWNGEISASSKEAILYSYFAYCLRNTFQKILKSEFEITEIVNNSNLVSFLLKNDTFRIGEKTIVVNDFLEECLKATQEHLQKDFGEDYNKADYSYYSSFDIKHLVHFPGLGAKVTDAGGNVNTPNVNTQRVHGASMRSIIIMDEKPKALTVLAGGQSGRANSSNYKNQLEDWKNVLYHKAQFTAKHEELKNINNVISIKADE